jgi:class 3 adenylate cyclase/tetratricopeptide (TPR) repeat protein
MDCTSCGATNAAGRKFCSQCGARLTVACPACGTAANAGDLFCGECGGPLGSSGGGVDRATSDIGNGSAPAVSERRLVSVLFADLVGFTSLSESRDAEDVRELLTGYFDTGREIIERYGGVVEKFIGDAVMAVFGTPTTHEDDAERAVRAGLELILAVRELSNEIDAPGLQLRAGVTTGEAAVTIGAAGQGMVAGDMVNTASRLQSAAPPGTLLVDEATMRAAAVAIIFEPGGEKVLKGKELPVSAWRADRVVAMRGGANRSEALEPPFVGRDAEMRILKELLHATAREQRARLVTFLGVAGIGKSRLAWEFHKYIDGVVEDIYWHQGRSPAYGEGITFWALGEMVRKRAGLAESDDPTTTRERIAATVTEYVVDPEERRWVEPRLLQLLGVEDGRTGEREELFAAWRTFFERVSERGTTILLFEDLQWADPGLLDFIDHVLEWSRGHPILIVTMARPDLLERRPDWGAGRRNAVALSLEPLSDEVMSLGLDGLVPGLPDRTVTMILERADGVPLYAVEIVRMLLHQGRLVAEDGAYRPVGDLSHLEIPESLQALIAARLDSLDAPERFLVQVAAVLGLSFTLQGLAAITGEDAASLEPRLRDLVRREFLELNVDPRSPERGQYSFVHRLIREVAYGTLSKRDRRARHLAAARYFEALGDEEIAGVLATHYLDAYRSAPEGDEGAAVAAQARVALRAAADRAAGLHSHDQALAYLVQALEVAPAPADRAELLDRAGVAAVAAGRYEAGEAYLREAIDLWRRLGDQAAAARTSARNGELLLRSGFVDQAMAEIRDALDVLGDVGSDPALVELHARLAQAYMRAEQNDLAVEWADRALAGAERLDMLPAIAEGMITKATAMGSVGRMRESEALLKGVLDFADENDLPASQMRARLNLSNWMWTTDPRRGLMVARDGIEIARRLGDRPWYVLLTNNAIACATRTGDWDWALEREAELRALDLEPADLLSLTDTPIIRACRGVDVSEAVAELEELARALSDPSQVGVFLIVQAWQAVVTDELEGAFNLAMRAADASVAVVTAATSLAAHAAAWRGDRAGLDRAIHTLEQTGIHGPAIEAGRRTMRAAHAGFEGRASEAGAAFRDASRQWRDLGLQFDLALCHLDLLATLGATGPAARAVADEARMILLELQAEPFLRRLEALEHAGPSARPSRVDERADVTAHGSDAGQ